MWPNEKNPKAAQDYLAELGKLAKDAHKAGELKDSDFQRLDVLIQECAGDKHPTPMPLQEHFDCVVRARDSALRGDWAAVVHSPDNMDHGH